jgi:hypothetical protein
MHDASTDSFLCKLRHKFSVQKKKKKPPSKIAAQKTMPAKHDR